MDLYQDWRHDTCLGCSRCVFAEDPALRTSRGWLVWMGWNTEPMLPWEYSRLTAPGLADLLTAPRSSR